MNDLFGFVEGHPEYWSADGVRFNAQGIAAQAIQVVTQIAEAMP